MSKYFEVSRNARIWANEFGYIKAESAEEVRKYIDHGDGDWEYQNTEFDDLIDCPDAESIREVDFTPPRYYDVSQKKMVNHIYSPEEVGVTLTKAEYDTFVKAIQLAYGSVSAYPLLNESNGYWTESLHALMDAIAILNHEKK